jgi:hypothetical protein
LCYHLIRNAPIHIKHIAENITHPIVGTITANRIPKPMQKAKNPISLFFLKKLIMLPPIFFTKDILSNYIKKQLYSRYAIIAIAATTTKYHRNIGMNLEIRKTERMIHKQPAYRL